ncbi:MAG: TIGR03960 family B12-binding radical SAM protein [Planctomycetes bacterium]|nr:TIGR03960 family B12-binding radical SAM protein [Planctomycetota bacterium]
MSGRPPVGENLWDQMGKQGFRSGQADRTAPGADLGRIPDADALAGHPYLPFLHRVEKPGRYIGGEVHSIRKPDAEVSIALAFPDTYEIGMSHLGYKILYSHLNGIEGMCAERVYAPWPDLESELRARGLPLVSLESWRPLEKFDCVGFSLQYELTFTNILTMLDLGRIPLRGAERADDAPLIMAGGPVAFQPEPMAHFIDAFLVGDGEGFFAETVAAWAAMRRERVPRRERLRRLSALPGIYVPSLYRTGRDPATELEVVLGPLEAGVPPKVHRAHVPDISRYPFPAETPVANTEVVFDRASIEIARGCTEGCRFCQAGMIYRPVRERDPEQVAAVVRDSVRCGGYDEVSLTSLSTADYSAVQPLVHKVVRELQGKNVSVSVSSLRAYGLSEALLDDIASVRNTSLTFAPEAGTQRMRDVVNKNISEDDIAISAHRIFSRGWKGMKLYFMIGLPTETDEDVAGIAETGKRLLSIAHGYLPRGRAEVTVSVSSHVPKPFTPFQWAAMDDIPEIERKHEVLKEATRVPGLKLKWHEPQASHLEGILSRGDRALGDVIESAWRKGCRFDSWGDHLRFDLWMEAIEEAGIDRFKYLRTMPVDGRLPWDHLHCGVEWEFLIKEYRKAVKGRFSPPCGKVIKQKVHHASVEAAEGEQKKLICFDCGVACDMSKMREERIEFLRRLDAHRSGPEREEETVAEVAARTQLEVAAKRRAAGVRKGARPLPPARAGDAWEVHAYRLVFTKLGRARFTSHLDLVRMFPRAFRRAGLEVGYTAGFHPLPHISYGPPLRLGMASIGEMLEVKLKEAIEPAELIARVNEELPDGIVFRVAEAVPKNAPRFSRVTAWADYLVFLAAEHAAGLFDPEALAALTRGGALVIQRRKRDGAAAEIDIAGGIAAATLLDRLPADCSEFLRLDDEDRLLELRLALTGAAAPRPEEVLILLGGGQAAAAARIVRRRLLSAPMPAPLAATV